MNTAFPSASDREFPPLTGRTVILKLDPEPFKDTLAGLKRFEIRKDDRAYQVGDVLLLCETTVPHAELAPRQVAEKTGRTTFRRVTSILRGPVWGLAEGWVVMSTIAVLEALPQDDLLSCLARMQVDAERLQAHLDAARAAAADGRVLSPAQAADVATLANHVEQSEGDHFREFAEHSPEAADKHIFLVAQRVQSCLA